MKSRPRAFSFNTLERTAGIRRGAAREYLKFAAVCTSISEEGELKSNNAKTFSNFEDQVTEALSKLSMSAGTNKTEGIIKEIEKIKKALDSQQDYKGRFSDLSQWLETTITELPTQTTGPKEKSPTQPNARKFSVSPFNKFDFQKAKIISEASLQCVDFIKLTEDETSDFNNKIRVELAKLSPSNGALTKGEVINAITQLQVTLHQQSEQTGKFSALSQWLNDTLAELLPPPPHPKNNDSAATTTAESRRSPSPTS